MEKCGFTLAEVLITLGIIGVVAAMTIPTLINKHHTKVVQTALKKTYSELGQAVNMLMYDNGNTLEGLCDNDNDHNCFAHKLAEKMKINKICDGDSEENDERCWGRANAQERPHIVLSDGRIYQVYHDLSKCIQYEDTEDNVYYIPGATQCGSVFVDINGLKGPNSNGKDIFFFVISKKGVYPGGSPLIFKESENNTPDCTQKINHFCTYHYLYDVK